MNYNNLRGKTVFDFTTDEAILNKLFPNYTENEKQKISSCLQSNPVENGFYLWGFAEMSGDGELLQAIEQQFDMNAVYAFDPD